MIFSNIAQYHLDWLDTQCKNSFDCIAILLIALVTDEFKQIMKVRKIPILDTYFHKVDEIIWPRFSTIFEHFIQNIKSANAAQYPSKDINVHFTTKRYVTLT